MAGVDPEYREGGVMKVALDDELREVLQDNLIWQGELGMGVHWIDQDELREREPHVTPDAQGAVLSPNEGSIRGEVYVNSLAHAAAGLGATILERTEVTGLEWSNNKVVLTLDPHVSLSAHVLDFIALDGSVAMSLVADEATVDSAAGTYSWPMTTRPWEDGDQLMVRIREG